MTGDFGIKETTLRVALTRMVGAGDLIRSSDGYRLSDRLLVRQRRQDDAIRPLVRPWDGSWTTVIVTSVGVDARDRAALRKALQDNRLAELREGVWLRPDNLRPVLTPETLSRVRMLHSYDDAPAELAWQLWDLSGWVHTGHRLLDEMATAAGIPERFISAATMVRHLLTDPVLPDELLPDNWPGAELRASYTKLAAELGQRRDQHELMEAK